MMTATQIDQRQYPIEVRAEARRIADRCGARYEDLPRIEAAVAHRMFMESTEPMRKAVARLCGDFVYRPFVVVSPGAVGELPKFEEMPVSPHVTESLRLLNEMLSVEAKRWGLSSPDLPPESNVSC